MKLTTNAEFRYDSRDATTWVGTLRNYMVQCCWELKELLPWAESFQHNEIYETTISNLSGNQNMYNIVPLPQHVPHGTAVGRGPHYVRRRPNAKRV